MTLTDVPLILAVLVDLIHTLAEIEQQHEFFEASCVEIRLFYLCFSGLKSRVITGRVITGSILWMVFS